MTPGAHAGHGRGHRLRDASAAARRGPLLGQGQRPALGDAPVAPTSASAPLLPGMPAPPHIRPLNPAPAFGLSAWASAVGAKRPGLATVAPSPAPSPTHSARTAR
ncbi:hypothetical protein STENM223S_10905 [Streptomyces tendae]